MLPSQYKNFIQYTQNLLRKGYYQHKMSGHNIFSYVRNVASIAYKKEDV